MFKGKRAEEILSSLYYVGFGLILSAMFLFAVFARVNTAIKDSTYEKRFYARDLALVTDAIHTANGDISLDYDFASDKNLKINLEETRVSVYDYDKKRNDTQKTYFLVGYDARSKDLHSGSDDLITLANKNSQPLPDTVTPSRFSIDKQKGEINFVFVNSPDATK